MIGVKLILIAVMIYITALFVAAEFSLVKVRSSKLEQLEANGEKNAKLALHLVHHLDDYLSACQLGITLTTLIIGGVGEETVRSLLSPLIGQLPLSKSVSLTVSLILSYFLVTFVEVVVGELLPKSYSIANSEKVVLAIAKPLHIFYKMTYLFIKLLNHSANLIGKAFGIHMIGEAEETLSEEEIILVAADSLDKGEINKEEFEYLSNIFEFDERQVKEIMTNRLDMKVLDYDMTVKEAIPKILDVGYSRFPVIKESKDEIMGYVTLQQLVRTSYIDDHRLLAEEVAKPIVVMETMVVKDVLKKMQEDHKHIAMVVDEYGGTVGIVTIEDIVEEIVGDIQDELDTEKEKIQSIGKNEYLVEGKIELDEIRHFFNLDDMEDPNGNVTLGGYCTSIYPSEVEKGFSFDVEGVIFTILLVRQTVVEKIKIKDTRK
ncbi:hemolysin family protein [Vagococcus carniphilus]|uniref:hemolysin family protein n=1 Tax=Vagococcus carniphilus TaxID=218144 RepID=UPI00288D828E|nr:hemolysin family protein [Vagococcus carniphilus]MDT2831424.1 hemolysin family protein [Vagococcus carniphilus]MDT2840146.1 hemolysin family protein [Vagococcus carniphilus]MDT2849498.1 hemolysin family protein [Vagococcus carniphilus]MDT2855031.1 hemolysin family protein [Vagococcus carniphilus]MDT2864760.1 hemolysin family protein [Vagococcus carniphilus]